MDRDGLVERHVLDVGARGHEDCVTGAGGINSRLDGAHPAVGALIDQPGDGRADHHLLDAIQGVEIRASAHLPDTVRCIPGDRPAGESCRVDDCVRLILNAGVAVEHVAASATGERVCSGSAAESVSGAAAGKQIDAIVTGDAYRHSRSGCIHVLKAGHGHRVATGLIRAHR